jgi:hypothetical protein
MLLYFSSPVLFLGGGTFELFMIDELYADEDMSFSVPLGKV